MIKYMNVYEIGTIGKGTPQNPRVFVGGCLCDNPEECKKKITKPVHAIAKIEWFDSVEYSTVDLNKLLR